MTKRKAWEEEEGAGCGHSKREKGAKEYPFTLDSFQEEAVRFLEAGHSVLVSAHTSAGKTAVAEYAIAMSLRNNRRVLYTSPIKALSNQKFRQLSEEFFDVGLMTGDVTISPNASCLVMTTEILRNMQYRGSEIMQEVAWIIFDEVHYMCDRERGVVWEESIIMAPKNARFVFLSATVPNAKEFADWVTKVHGHPCHVVYTDLRPTPLQHYIFPSGGNGLYLVVDEEGTFREDNFQKAVTAVSIEGNSYKRNSKRQRDERSDQTGETSDIFKIVKMIMLRQFDPLIVFSFSKRDCESLAMQMFKFDLNDEGQKKLVDRIFWNAMDSLSDDDKRLPQVRHLLPLLKRGIGVHHSGLLPILKEVVEILFQDGLLKCLFATETFSMGLNMPAKTVVFTNARKFDGVKFRWLTSGEYIQMSGRAGRRGLDDRGICIMMLDEKMEPSVARMMIKGSADPLNSAFHLSYNMLLNQMRCEESNPEMLLRRSFYQFQCDRALPQLEEKVAKLKEQKDCFFIEREEEVEEYWSLVKQYRKLQDVRREIVSAPRYSLPFLQPGRLVCIRVTLTGDGDDDVSKGSRFSKDGPIVWGVIINFEKVKSPSTELSEDFIEEKPAVTRYMVDVLAKCAKTGENKHKPVHPVSLNEDGEPLVISVPLSEVCSLSSIRIFIPKDLRPLEARESTLNRAKEVFQNFPDGVQLLDPEDDMQDCSSGACERNWSSYSLIHTKIRNRLKTTQLEKLVYCRANLRLLRKLKTLTGPMQVEDSAYRKATRKAEAVEALLEKHALVSCPTLMLRLKKLQEKHAVVEMLHSLRREIRTASTLAFKSELKSKRRVLRRLGYTTTDDVVELKGRVACEISSADELVVTELLFDKVFKEAAPEQVVALLSCFVWHEKVKSNGKLREELATLYSLLRDTARKVGKVQLECKLAVDIEEYADSFRSDIMETVHAWCRGVKFADIMKSAQVFEGSLIRAMRSLKELLQELVLASRAMGDEELQGKFEEGIALIEKDIVFAASLNL